MGSELWPKGTNVQLQIAKRALNAAELARKAHPESEPVFVAYWCVFDAYQLALSRWLAEHEIRDFDLERSPNAPPFLAHDVPDLYGDLDPGGAPLGGSA